MAPEITYMKACILPDRALELYRAKYPHIEEEMRGKRLGPHADPNHILAQIPCLLGEPIVYTERVAKMCINGTAERKNAPVDEVVGFCVKVLTGIVNNPDPDWPADVLERWATHAAAVEEDRVQVLGCAKVAVFHRCRLSTFLVSSGLTLQVNKAVGKSEASSYCLAHTVGEEGARKIGPCFVKYVVLMRWGLGLCINRMAVVCPVPFKTKVEEVQAFGQIVFRFDKAEFDRKKSFIANTQIIPVEDLIRPFILIRPPDDPNMCMWRLVQFQGKLLGTFEEDDFWQDGNAE